MTSDEFRLLALGLADVRLVNQLGNLQFMVGDKVFASLSAPDPDLALLRLTPDQQAKAMSVAPSVFHPQAGGAGARGVTCMRLSLATPQTLMPFLKAALAKARSGPAQRPVPGRR